MKRSPLQFVPILGLALSISSVASSASAQPRSKLDSVLRAAARADAVHRVIIQARPGSRLALKKALQAHGDAVEAEHPALNALTVVLHAADLEALQADPSVLSISVDAQVRSFATVDGSEKSTDAARKQRAQRAQAVGVLREGLGLSTVPFDGAGINVAIVDSGIAATKDLAASIGGFWDFTRGGVQAHPRDDYGHGTHVAGLIASSGIESNSEFAGIAPSSTLYGFKVLDGEGRGRSSDVVGALEFIVANKLSTAPGSLKIDIINLSLGHPIYEPAITDPLVRAVENAVRAGIVVVTAAGNIGMNADGDSGYAGITSPGNAPSAITVGAVDTKQTISISDDTVASFSSRGPTWFDGLAKPDLVAPGVGLTSDAPRVSSLFDHPQSAASTKDGRGTFGMLSGTSMAAAVTTGVTSLVVQASRVINNAGPVLTPNAVKALLQYTAFVLKDSTGQAYDALTQGTGEINARGAVDMALAINTDMPIGSQWLRVTPQPATSLGGVLLPWSRALIWDDNIVWGTDALAFNSPLWADNIVWGTAFDEADNIVWGTAEVDNIVWGTAAEIDNIVWGTAATWTSDLVWRNRIIGLMLDDDNIVWGTATGLDADNIVWGTYNGDTFVWGTHDGENIVWGTTDVDNIVWGTSQDADNIVWGTSQDADNIVWGTFLMEDNIVWGTAATLVR